MSKQELIRKLNKKFMKKSIPVIKAGHTVKVVSKFKEGDKERTQSFEGLVIKVNGKSGDINSTITVRKISEGVGVERIFPIHSTNVVSIEIIKIAKVRRAKLYYMRDRFGKSARLKEIRTTQTNRDEMVKTFGEEKVQVPDTNSEEVKEGKKEVANNNKEKVNDKKTEDAPEIVEKTTPKEESPKESAEEKPAVIDEKIEKSGENNNQ